ncbi:hypothetical protein ACJJTC_006333 [Scirpophaga incertulas]
MATLCVACLSEVKNKCELKCSRCKEYYHFQCVGYVAESYKRLDIDFKKKWICTSCNCKQRKPGNNSETPARNNVHLSPLPNQSDYDNITLRAKPKETPNTSPSPHSHISEETLRSIIRQEVVHILGESLKKHVDGPIRELKNEIRSIHDFMSFINEKFEELKPNCAEQFSVVQKITQENTTLHITIQTMSERLSRLDQLSRASNLEIQCVPESNSENVIKLVQQLGRTVKCPIKEQDIFYCSRIAKMIPNNTQPRSILVKLAAHGCVIPYSFPLYQSLSQSCDQGIGGKTSCPIYDICKFVWIRGGKISMRKDDSANYTFVKNTDTLSRLT